MKALLLALLAIALAASVQARALAQTPSIGSAPPSLTLTCKTTVAPVAGTFVDKGVNRGVAPPGFVSLGPDVPVEHGVDVSKWQQDVDPFVVKQCGGAFAYIRISAGRLGFNEVSYPSTWGQARAANLLVGGYHYLTFLPDSIEHHTLKADVSPQQITAEFEKLGHQQADLFLQRYRALRDDDLKRNPRAQFLPPMVDINDRKPLPVPFGEPKKEWVFATVCAFIDDVEREPWLHGQRLILFTDPGTFEERDFADAPCLKGGQRIVWVQYPSPGAGGLPETADDPSFEAVRELCNPADESRRCLFHQYTNRGGIPMGSLSEGLDLSRYLGSKSLHDLAVGG